MSCWKPLALPYAVVLAKNVSRFAIHLILLHCRDDKSVLLIYSLFSEFIISMQSFAPARGSRIRRSQPLAPVTRPWLLPCLGPVVSPAQCYIWQLNIIDYCCWWSVLDLGFTMQCYWCLILKWILLLIAHFSSFSISCFFVTSILLSVLHCGNNGTVRLRNDTIQNVMKSVACDG